RLEWPSGSFAGFSPTCACPSFIYAVEGSLGYTTFASNSSLRWFPSCLTRPIVPGARAALELPPAPPDRDSSLHRLIHHTDSDAAPRGAFSLRLPACTLTGQRGRRRGQPPVLEAQNPRASRGQVHVVRHQDRGEAVACVQPLNQVEYASGGGLVQVAGGF